MTTKKFSIICLMALSSVLSVGCGVRGAPQPPLTPAELGRGQPTFKRATEGFAFPDVPSPYGVPAPTPSPQQGKGDRN